jgi:heme/copper-type cytochrome/quinol oxidase subunit 3
LTNTRVVLDVSNLPDGAVGARAPLWWGILGLLSVEGAVFALGIASYFYLRMRYTSWPPTDAGPPDLTMPLINLAVILASWVPQNIVNKLALRDPDKRRIEKNLIIATVLGFAACVLRIWDFRALNCDWTEHSYGSIVWALVFLHTIHLFTSTIETALMATYVSRAELDPKHRLDLNVNSVYWGFVVISWVILFAVIWGAGRAL